MSKTTKNVKRRIGPCDEWRLLYAKWEDTGAARRHEMDLREACSPAIVDPKSETQWLEAARRAVFHGEPVSA